MTRTEYFQKAKDAKAKYEAKVEVTTQVLNTFPKSENGLTPDEVKNTQEFQTASRNFHNAFNDLRNFNANYVKTFKVELKAEREEAKKLRQVKAG